MKACHCDLFGSTECGELARNETGGRAGRTFCPSVSIAMHMAHLCKRKGPVAIIIKKGMEWNREEESGI